jgi:probable phosphoglycerate mutase
VVNAAVRGGDYQWHLGADPRALDGFGYPNREPGKPYFVTMLLYVNGGWPRGWDAETFFLDTKSDSGVFVRPAQFRTVLVDQDVMYRMSAPSKLANGTPSYSIAWKLLFVPKDSAMPPSVAKTDWGPSMRLGAANVV